MMLRGVTDRWRGWNRATCSSSGVDKWSVTKLLRQTGHVRCVQRQRQLHQYAFSQQNKQNYFCDNFCQTSTNFESVTLSPNSITPTLRQSLQENERTLSPTFMICVRDCGLCHKLSPHAVTDCHTVADFVATISTCRDGLCPQLSTKLPHGKVSVKVSVRQFGL